MIVNRKNSRRFLLPAIALGLVVHFGCTARPPVSLYNEKSCTPAEVINQARQKLTSLHIATTEPAAEGKGLSITTDDIFERQGKQERTSKYKLIVMPVENSDRSSVSLQRLESKTKGVRERKWYDDEASAAVPDAEQRIWDQINSICLAQQP